MGDLFLAVRLVVCGQEEVGVNDITLIGRFVKSRLSIVVPISRPDHCAAFVVWGP